MPRHLGRLLGLLSAVVLTAASMMFVLGPADRPSGFYIPVDIRPRTERSLTSFLGAQASNSDPSTSPAEQEDAHVHPSSTSPNSPSSPVNDTSPPSSSDSIPASTSTSGSTVAADTVLAGDLTLTNPTIAAGDTMTFDPNVDTTLRVQGDLMVRGTLVMRPAPDVVHRILFEDRGEFLVTGGGTLDIRGTPKVAWNRTGTDPSWKPSDELIVAPIAPGDYQHHPYRLGDRVPSYEGYATEVANLTRNVIIDGPARIMLMELDGHAPQVIKYATISNAGIRDQLGFYALHFHLNGNATRGSIVEGVLVRDANFRAFVPHGSHGITFRDTLAVDVVANGYWWDLNRASDPPSNIHESNDITYERAGVIGLNVSSPPDQRRQSAFNLGDGDGNRVLDSFAAGVLGSSEESGFHWPETAHSVWKASDLMSHNNKAHGFFIWQNDASEHLVSGVTALLNQRGGINQGAYSSSYVWSNVRLVGNSQGIILNTLSKPEPRPRHTFECVWIAESEVGVLVDLSHADEGLPALMKNLVVNQVDTDFLVTDRALAQGQTLDTRVERQEFQVAC